MSLLNVLGTFFIFLFYYHRNMFQYIALWWKDKLNINFYINLVLLYYFTSTHHISSLVKHAEALVKYVELFSRLFFLKPASHYHYLCYERCNFV